MINRETIIELAREANRYAHQQANDSFEWQEIRDEHFAKLVAEHERESIKDEWWMCVQSDLEHGVRSLNEKAATEWRSKYPAMAGFGTWLEERNNHDER